VNRQPSSVQTKRSWYWPTYIGKSDGAGFSGSPVGDQVAGAGRLTGRQDVDRHVGDHVAGRPARCDHTAGEGPLELLPAGEPQPARHLPHAIVGEQLRHPLGLPEVEVAGVVDHQPLAIQVGEEPVDRVQTLARHTVMLPPSTRL
jgi:hypothetical protein